MFKTVLTSILFTDTSKIQSGCHFVETLTTNYNHRTNSQVEKGRCDRTLTSRLILLTDIFSYNKLICIVSGSKQLHLQVYMYTCLHCIIMFNLLYITCTHMYSVCLFLNYSTNCLELHKKSSKPTWDVSSVQPLHILNEM